MATLEQQVSTLANTLIQLGASAVALKKQIDDSSAAWTNLGAANLLNNFNTAAATSSGGLGTADATPNVTHPIDTRTGSGSQLVQAMSSTQLATLLTSLQGISSVIGGAAVAINGATVPTLALTH